MAGSTNEQQAESLVPGEAGGRRKEGGGEEEGGTKEGKARECVEDEGGGDNVGDRGGETRRINKKE